MAIGTPNKLFFSRDTKMFVKLGTFYWEIPVLDGFSFSQGNNTTEVTLNEAQDSSGNSKRARQLFNDSLAPAEFSFSTYLRPFKSAAGSALNSNQAANTAAEHHAVEEVLWAVMTTNAHGYTQGSGSGNHDFATFTRNTSQVDIAFSQSNKPALQEFELFFQLGGVPTAATDGVVVYKLTKAVINEASIDFDIDGLATINWSGFAASIDQHTTHPATQAAAINSGIVNEAVIATNNYIRNRASSLALSSKAGTATRTAFAGGSGDDVGKYALTLTGGNITISNNITFLTPETIGSVNVPFAHVTGARSVSGTLNCYLGLDTTNAGTNIGTSTDFFVDANSAAARAIVTNEFELDIDIGGGTAPNVLFDMDNVHMEIPQINIEDTIQVETAFHALPSNVSSTDEITKIRYVGVTPDA